MGLLPFVFKSSPVLPTFPWSCADLLDLAEEVEVVLVGGGALGGDVGDFGDLEVVDDVLEVEFDRGWGVLFLDGQADVAGAQALFHEQVLDFVGVLDVEGQLAAFPFDGVQAAFEVHLGAGPLDPQCLGADGVSLPGPEQKRTGVG